MIQLRYLVIFVAILSFLFGEQQAYALSVYNQVSQVDTALATNVEIDNCCALEYSSKSHSTCTMTTCAMPFVAVKNDSNYRIVLSVQEGRLLNFKYQDIVQVQVNQTIWQPPKC